MTIKAVIFDMDGVLTDSEPVINVAAIAGLKEYGVNAVPEDFEQFVGMGEDKYIGGVAEKYGVAYVLEMKKRVYEIYLEILPGLIHSFTGVHELLHKLREGEIPMAVASSADRVKVKANLEAIEVDLGWFDAIVVGEDVANKKPAPDTFLCAADKLGMAPAECCVVEDALHGVQAAKAAGIRCVAVEQSFSADLLRQAEPDVICPGISDVSLTDLGVG